MPELVRVASVDDLPPGTGGEFVAGGRVIALYNVDGEFFALDGICPHAGGPLGKGMLTGTIVTCPWHGWQFDVATGRHCLNPNLMHTAFPVSVREGAVYVEIP